MNPLEPIPAPAEALDEIDADNTESVDLFLKELEEKEKDLHITADLTIEIEESEFDPRKPAAIEVVQPAPNGKPASADAARQVGLKTKVYELEQEVSRLNARCEVLKQERNDTQEKSDRRLKDFESYKYRMDRERRGAFIDQITNLASQMLPVLDNLDRALDSVKGLDAEMSPEFRQFYDGIALVNQQLGEIFGEMGVQPIVTVGHLFDPNLHEAVATEEDASKPANTITAEMLRGFRIGNRVIRHSMVKVTTQPPAPAKPTASKSEDSSDPILQPSDNLPD